MTHPVPPALLLFDLDGCLVDSTLPITSCMNAALRGLGLPAADPQRLAGFIGPPLSESFAVLLAEAGADPALLPEAVRRYRERYAQESLRTTRIVPGMEDVLDRLATTSRMAVVTSKPEAFAVPILRTLGLLERFVAVHAPGTDLVGEPKTATLRRALEDVAGTVRPSDAIMIGDRHHDVRAGLDCGTLTVGVTWGIGDRDELVTAGAHHVVDHPCELVALLAAPPGP